MLTEVVVFRGKTGYHASELSENQIAMTIKVSSLSASWKDKG